jgi:hypothetical protein
MFTSCNRFAPSLEVLEARETPSSVSGRITGVAVDPTDPSTAVPTGSVTFIVDGVSVSTSDANDGRKYKMLVAPLILDADADAARHFNGFVSRFSAGGSDEMITIGGPQTEATSAFTLTFNGQTTS